MEEKIDSALSKEKRKQLPIFKFYFKHAANEQQIQLFFNMLENCGVNVKEFQTKQFYKLFQLYTECNEKRWPIEIQRIITYLSFALVLYAFVGLANKGGEFLAASTHQYWFPWWGIIIGVLLPWVMLGYITSREDNRSSWKAMSKANEDFVSHQQILERKLAYKDIRTIIGEDFRGAFVEFMFLKAKKAA
jgi:hypothetical protein